MTLIFPSILTQASTDAAKIDQLFFIVVVICAVVFFGIIIVMIYLGFKYRAKSEVNRNNPPLSHIGLELSWSIPTLIVFIGFFIAGASLYTNTHTIEKADIEIYVTAKQWMWKFHHSDGRHEVDQLHVPVGKKIKLTMISEDVVHSLFLPDFRIKQDVLPARYTSLVFKASKEGKFRIYCTQYCGSKHAKMLAEVIVMNQEHFTKWNDSPGTWFKLGPIKNNPIQAQGKKLFNTFGCNSCHATQSTDVTDKSLVGPNLWNIYGSEVALNNGEKILVDDNYIHQSVFEPNAKIVKGFTPQMPTYEGIMSKEEFRQVLFYLKTLRPEKKGE